MKYTYTVRYKLKNSFFWRTLKNIKADAVPSDMPEFRVLISDNEDRYEIPKQGTQFHFSNERFLVIKQNAEQQVGAPISIKSKIT